MLTISILQQNHHQPKPQDFTLGSHILPLIKQPSNTNKPEAYYTTFDRARTVLAHPRIIELIQQCANQQFTKAWRSNRPLLLTSSSDLVGECYRGLLKKIQTEGLTCENVEQPIFNALNWLRVVFSNQAKDRLRFKVPSIQMCSIDAAKENKNTRNIEIIFQSYDASEEIEQKEINTIQHWFENLELKVVNSKDIRLSPVRRLIWKLVHKPKYIVREDFIEANIKEARNSERAYQLFSINKTTIIHCVENDNSRKTNSKNFVLWLLFGMDYTNPEQMIHSADESWIRTIRDNQIRRTENRADAQIWKVILIGLLSDRCPPGYKELYISLIQYALLRAKNCLPYSRKRQEFFSKTSASIISWAWNNISSQTKASVPKLNDVFAILTSDIDSGSIWRKSNNAKIIDPTYRLLRIAKKIIHNKNNQSF
jgi:hypothetical protein